MLPFAVTYDLVNRQVVLSGTTGAVVETSAEALYSHWKDEMATSHPLAASPVVWFNSIGGNDLGGGSTLDGYWFLNNDDWTIVLDDRDHTFKVSQIFAGNTAQGLWTFPPTGDVAVEVSVSARSIVTSGGSDLSTVLTAVSNLQIGVDRLLDNLDRLHLVTVNNNDGTGTMTLYADDTPNATIVRQWSTTVDAQGAITARTLTIEN